MVQPDKNPANAMLVRKRRLIDAFAPEKLECLVAAQALNPFDLDTTRTKILFEPALFFEHETQRIVVGPVESQFIDLGGLGWGLVTEQDNQADAWGGGEETQSSDQRAASRTTRVQHLA